MPDYKSIRYKVHNQVAEIAINREQVNAIDMQLAKEAVDGYGRVRKDTAVHAVILTSCCW